MINTETSEEVEHRLEMLRWSVGLTLKDRMRNEQVRARVAVGLVIEKLREIRLSWMGYLVRGEQKLCGKESRSEGGWTKKKREIKTEMERLYKE